VLLVPVRDEQSTGTRPWADDTLLAGSLLVLGSAVALLGIVTAQALYPGYEPTQALSALGVAPAGTTTPATVVFNGTMLLTGGVVLAAATLVARALDRRVAVALGLFGVGLAGVGVFPLTVRPWHTLFALLAFASGGLSAAVTGLVVRRPFSWLCVAVGAVSLGALSAVLVLGPDHPFFGLGFGGIERWIVYPLVVWGAGLGGYLLSDARAA